MPIFEINLPKSIQKALGIPPRSPKRAQLRVLKKLLRRARYTAFGQKFHFDKILLGRRPDKVFQQSVPAYNYNKIYNYTTMDLGKKEDEFGFPVLITDADNYKDKEVSYFLGIPLSKKFGLTDNNFSFRTQAPTQNYIMYYKGTYTGRVKAIQQLIQKAKKDEMRFGDIRQTFLERPVEDGDVNMKLSLSVFK